MVFRDCRVGEGSELEETLLLPKVHVGRKVRLHRVIVDKECVLPDGFQAGLDPAIDRKRFHVTEGGVTLVTANELH